MAHFAGTTENPFPFMKFEESTLAHLYLDGLGHGIEIGGSAHNAFNIANCWNVDYTADMATSFKLAEIKECGQALPVNVLSLGNTLPFADESLDFVLNSHVIEHFFDPIGALHEWMRILKPSGFIFCIVPHKERTFDKDRPCTPLAELIQRNNGIIPPPEVDLHSHYSVWTTAEFLELCHHLGFEVVDCQDIDDKVGNGFTVVIRKPREVSQELTEQGHDTAEQRSSSSVPNSTSTQLKLIGSINECRRSNLGLYISGWLYCLQSPIKALKISAGSTPSTVTVFSEREDVRKTHPQLPHILQSGFALSLPSQRCSQIVLTAITSGGNTTVSVPLRVDAPHPVTTSETAVANKSTVRRLKVAVLTYDPLHTACACLRIVHPFQHQDRYELTFPVKALSEQYHIIDNAIVRDADMVVVQRFFPGPERHKFLEQLLNLRKPIIYEVDDLITGIPPTNENHAFAESRKKSVKFLISRATAVTVSTVELKNVLSSLNRNIHVLPNLIDESLWNNNHNVCDEDVIVVGYAGTRTHQSDLRLVEEALIRISEKYRDKVRFQFLGVSTDRIAALPHFELGSFDQGYESFVRKLQNTSMSIALAPLQNNAFNRCKSNIKWLEYSACGMAGVYSDLPPYNLCVRHGETGFLAGPSTEEWFNAIDLLISDRQKRLMIANQAKREVLAEYTVAAAGSQFGDVYLRIWNAYYN